MVNMIVLAGFLTIVARIGVFSPVRFNASTCYYETDDSSSQGHTPLNAADVPTLLGTGSFSLLSDDVKKGENEVRWPPGFMRWPHMLADQVRGLGLREIGGGFSRHHRAPTIRAASYAIVKPSTMFQKMENLKKLRGHRNAVYCAIFDRLGRYVITGSDDLVKIVRRKLLYAWPAVADTMVTLQTLM
ncbi:bromodomain and WD repeat-containing protein 3-like [Helianthus annuus]|uniref:bromodomain and WD repeat-containing protein 3-like n=1 Tax=Helianthus annuus TaxID=4232 RepID=UPI000B8F2CF4|nr:bromodomain and WD repeat-containing protein 3-like [Helianthus annuus]